MTPALFIIRDQQMLRRACARIADLPLDHPIEILVRDARSKRSPEQNRRLHALLTEIADAVVIDGRKFHRDVWKEHFKREFLGVETITLPGGKTIEITPSTAELSTLEFCTFMDQIERWAAEHGILTGM